MSTSNSVTAITSKMSTAVSSKQLQSKVASVDKSVSKIGSTIAKASDKSLGLNKAPKAPSGMPGHVAVEHGIRPVKGTSSSLKTLQNSGYTN